MDKKGITYAVVAYLLWGILPLYWRSLQSVAAIELLYHRLSWSFVFLLPLVLIKKSWRANLENIADRQIITRYVISGVLVGLNWLTFVWAVNAGFIVEASLGYFINPLFSVLLGVVFLKERLRFCQWISVFLAGIGVVYLTFVYGRLPWIALILALTFGLYGLSKKGAKLNSVMGLTVETGLLFIPAIVLLGYRQTAGVAAFANIDLYTDLLLAGAGIVTAVPLVLFAAAARRLPLYIIGLLQYIAPTLTFLLGVFYYQEPFSATRLIGFSFVWLALLLFVVEGLLINVFRKKATIPDPTVDPERGNA